MFLVYSSFCGLFLMFTVLWVLSECVDLFLMEERVYTGDGVFIMGDLF